MESVMIIHLGKLTCNCPSEQTRAQAEIQTADECFAVCLVSLVR